MILPVSIPQRADGDKRATVAQFRDRLGELIGRTGMSRARFAAEAGLDRSTLTQLLAADTVRLPRAETIARIAARHGVSADWLLGLSQRDQVAVDIVAQPVIEPDAGSPADARLARWHGEARGFKVRYVPATLPDQVKTEEVLAWETGKLAAPAARAWSAVARARIAHARRPDSEIEVCSSRQALEEFARGGGIWHGLAAAARHEQLRHIARLADELYPAYRWFLFDGRERFSVPYTVFGRQRAAIYLGDMYFVFTSTEHIRELTAHFDSLIRAARIQPPDVAALVRKLAGELT
jgi:transcriptional regulator with XRE-family HTH domain